MNPVALLKDAYTPPRITPSLLKQHLDAFVVGQDRAKRTLATAVYNHYQRIQELQRRDQEEEELLAQEERRRIAIHPRHPVEDEYPGQPQTTTLRGDGWNAGDQQSHQQQPPPRPSRAAQQPPPPLYDPTPLTLSKSNILLLGPSGVGKTLMAQTLARVLEVPFSMSDCTPFTQAGYIGEDAEVCVQRLLAAANYDVARAERGIICLDEIDKIAAASKSAGGYVGRDVGGEGVQQALLKLVEGTTVQVQAKPERGSGGGGGRSPSQQGYPPSPTNSPLSSGNMGHPSGQQSSPSAGAPGQKGEVYNVKTDNILFICAGAFNGLHKVILDRISKGSIGFGATVRAIPGTPSSPTSSSGMHETLIEGEDDLFEMHLPFYTPPESASTTSGQKEKKKHNTLDLVQPQDLQKYGLIPELVGRLPISCALSSLSIPALVQVLTEPRNSLLKQYEHLFHLSSIELRFTSAALWAVAERASKMGTGARGLRTVMEGLLADSMFECPGSGVRHVLVNEEVAKRKGGAVWFYKGQGGQMRGMIEEEEVAWEEKKRLERGDGAGEEKAGLIPSRTFEEYREKVGAAGF
ncbi:P-loop containing nucleoside triphosphate hydrolase protein [Neohortaea acidophila]|uniref:P-loop containing nucleoside triphosphate hydrolase protein n=1 Tax=Neohortaea acidophila TaxID=245834 RepID=A0A6A6PG48_9PEZI|nr:P-loop containing nucleoside triphosphate hydrolase protein [Neohortaea acidophila]KAF2478603.1 P-loop containing nucleoside triphosphate hydrolase protein [Neohortaea acidophila]